MTQHRYIYSLCSNKGHYDHQCHYTQQIINYATAASIKAQQQEDNNYNAQQQPYQNQYQETYTSSNPQGDTSQNTNQNF